MSHNDIGLETLSAYFHLPMCEVAKELGVCATVLKKICRRNGIPRWPHRKLKSIEKNIMMLEELILKGSEDEESVKKEINMLKIQKENLIKDPSILVQDKESNEFGYIPSKKRKKHTSGVNKQTKKQKCTFDDYSEEYLVYCAERTLTIFSKYSRKLSSSNSNNSMIYTNGGENSQPKAVYYPVSSCYYMPTFHPYNDPFKAQTSFNYSNGPSVQMAKCSEFQIPLDYSMLPYIYNQPKHQPDKPSPHTIKTLLNEKNSDT